MYVIFLYEIGFLSLKICQKSVKDRKKIIWAYKKRPTNVKTS